MTLIPLKGHLQSPEHCGPACLKMVFEYFGMNATEAEIANVAGTTEDGTTPQKMLRAARLYGFQAFYKEKSSLAEIRRFLKKGIPVIVNWFWHDDGHYSVVVGINEKSIILQDPEIGRRRILPLENFVHVWFDFPSRGLRRHSDIRIRPIIVVEPRAINH